MRRSIALTRACKEAAAAAVPALVWFWRRALALAGASHARAALRRDLSSSSVALSPHTQLTAARRLQCWWCERGQSARAGALLHAGCRLRAVRNVARDGGNLTAHAKASLVRCGGSSSGGVAMHHAHCTQMSFGCVCVLCTRPTHARSRPTVWCVSVGVNAIRGSARGSYKAAICFFLFWVWRATKNHQKASKAHTHTGIPDITSISSRHQLPITPSRPIALAWPKRCSWDHTSSLGIALYVFAAVCLSDRPSQRHERMT